MEDKIQKTQLFASVVKLSNLCFSHCINGDLNTDTLTKKEHNCINSCSSSYLDLYLNYKEFLKKDLETDDTHNINILHYNS
mmetsp:Transcript_33520/g.34825  ORF Transcript_33520/g.34825 Transcript_33520/m.34825 type:complete len:81 (-) Transcript_33520:5-247(-)